MVLVCFASLTMTWAALELSDLLLSHDCVRVAAPPREEWMGRLKRLLCHLARFNPHHIQVDTIVSLSTASLAAQSHADFSKTFADKTSILFI